MNANDQEFLDRLKATFACEADEHLRALSSCLMEMEKEASAERRLGLVETFFREAHSLKGAARSVGFTDIETICHSLESAFAALKNERITLSPGLCDLFQEALDAIARLVSAKGAKVPETDRTGAAALAKRLAEASAASRGQGSASPEPIGKTPSGHRAAPRPPAEESAAQRAPSALPPRQTNTVRISAARLDSLLLQAEELSMLKSTLSQRTGTARLLESMIVASKSGSARKGCLDEIESEAAALARALAQDQYAVNRLVDEHLEAMEKTAMIPVASLMEIFPRMVRDLAREQGKEVDLAVQGEEIQIDRRVLEEVKDPLIHLMRNCIDHGIRKPDERAARAKPRRGSVRVSFSTIDSRRMEITISDDGEGIELERVRKAAVESGVVSKEDVNAMDADEALSLIFRSGVSTSPAVTQVSGRGLGLAIVREKIEKLGGSVSVDTRPREGTAFRLVVPMTLATFRGVLVRAEGQTFAFPTINVDRAFRINRGSIKTLENRETISVAGRVIPLVRLSDALDMRRRTTAQSGGKSTADLLSVVLLSFAEQRMAFLVDKILDERQIMVKDLGRQLERVRNVAGATILGDGDLALVLNVSDLIKSAIRLSSAARPRADAEKAPPRIKRVLVAEDSITARSLLKNILETAGYRVTTAVDGADAYEKAREGEFDLVVSDVDMPRMNGFELTAAIRGDKRLSRVPVVLVTALESREDRERGIDVGASAYLVKSSFDQSDLLETMRRLL